MGSARSVLKVKRGEGGSTLLSDQRTGRRRAAFQSEESQRDWGVTASPVTVALQTKTAGCLQH